MLVGEYKYLGHNYTVEGYDFGDYVDLRLYPVLKSDRDFLDSGFHLESGDVDSASWESYWVQITGGFIKCDKYTFKDGEVLVTNQINTEALGALGNIIGGMKTGCNSANLVTEDEELFNKGFNPRAVFTYSYTNGTISKRMELTQSIEYENKALGIKLFLKDDGLYSKQIYPDNKSPYKIKLDMSEFINTTVLEDDEWDLGDNYERPFSLSEVIARNPNKNYLWLKDRKYYIVKPEEVERVCQYLWSFKFIAFDTETTGLKVDITSRRGEGDQLVGMVFSVKVGEAFYFPIAHKKIENICKPEEVPIYMEKYFKPLLEQRDILTQNGSFDWKVMHIYNICLNIIADLLILLQVTMVGDNPQIGLKLKEIEHWYLNRDAFELKDFVLGKFGVTVKFWDLSAESTKFYACPDTDCLLEIYLEMMKEGILEKYDAKKIYEIEVGFMAVIAYQEFYGHHVDMSRIDDLVADIKRSKEENYAEMVKIVGHDFNPKSNKDLPKVMFEELGMPVLEYTDAGNPSTNKDVRAALMEHTNIDGSMKYPFVKYLDEYLNARTLESNFTKNLDKFATEDGLMFSSVNQFLKTGRVSTSDPNYQSYSDVVKKYITPRDGYYAVDADYSTVEARIMCSMAECFAMVEKLKDPDTDYHRQKASDMFSVPYELVTKQLRQMAKGTNFGILYGLGDPNLGVHLYGVKTPENTRKAHIMKEKYYIGMEELKPFTETSRAQGVTQGFSTTYFGRRRWYNKAKVREDTIMRQSCNARIQGTAADIYKLGMVRLFTEIKNHGWVGKFLISAFVHDECYNEVHKSINPFLAIKVIREAMMIDIEGWTTLFTGVGVGSSWYEAKKTEIPVQVQETLVERFSDETPSWWDGDTKKLSNFINEEIRCYYRDRIINYLKNEENYGKVFRPADAEICHEVTSDIEKGVKYSGMVEGVEISSKKDMLEDLYEFCKAFGVEDLYEKADIRKPEVTQNNDNVFSDFSADAVEDAEVEEVPVSTLVQTMGVYLTPASSSKERVLYFRLDKANPVLMNMVKAEIEKDYGQNCKRNIDVRCFDGDTEYCTGLQTTAKAYTAIMKLYLTYRNLQRS